ncbi:hypothetical protein ACI3LY_003574 [Candidozyma auris]|uniref:Uncharacterized protein n=1 Tax=Candidozyma auris TaxID=498019 RepID=A0A2H0ZPR2_CANAR|nr:hypothetical_protein [[Candida] auris]PIS52659.1 hypothetical protein CJI97_002309 [[Candida] auris]PIS54969.1 hypothetical protein B9J08_002118 [[Candida] auris]PSK77893.1 hypothetical protein CJJ07_002242 [[Candida] auris]QEO21935.1 hypothetical_protein [[Candida] auris]GBL51653.1 hypothetical protein CAJCM15448_39270 [[Candida] auris]
MNYNYSLAASFQSARRSSSFIPPEDNTPISPIITSTSSRNSKGSPIDLDDITKEYQRYKRMLSTASCSSDKDFADKEIGLREMLDSDRLDTKTFFSTPRSSHVHLPTTSESIIKDYESKMERRRSV